MTADDHVQHVFISYVREDSEEVDSLCAVLEAAQIPYWRDRSALGPGDAWRGKIRDAVRSGSLVFLACFSENSRAKQKSYMNEELTLAVEEYRQMPPGRTWLIPVRFDDGEVPAWDLGAGRMLSDLNYSDLFGPERTTNLARLLSTVLRLTAEKRLDPASALAAVEQATDTGRSDLLKRLTKEMLLDPTRRIELDDLVSHEVQRVMKVLNDSERFGRRLSGTNDEIVVQLAEEADELWQLVKPFCASLQVAARWGTADALAPWTTGLRSFVGAANKLQGGTEALIALKHVPGTVGIVTAGVAAVSARRWDNLKVLVTDPTVRDRYEQKPLSIIEATDLHKPFANDWIANTVARAAQSGQPARDALADLTERRQQKFYTPAAEWLHHVLRPLFIEQWPDQDAYDAEFDRTEVLVGALAQDAVNVRSGLDGTEGRYWPRSYWFGRSTWRANHNHGNPVDDLMHDLATQGARWAPLEGKLFGGDPDRARVALEKYGERFSENARQRW